MNNNTKVTIDGVDCYGEIKFGKVVEVIFTNVDDSVLVTAKCGNWSDFINYLKERGYIPFSELVAES